MLDYQNLAPIHRTFGQIEKVYGNVQHCLYIQIQRFVQQKMVIKAE